MANVDIVNSVHSDKITSHSALTDKYYRHTYTQLAKISIPGSQMPVRFSPMMRPSL